MKKYEKINLKQSPRKPSAFLVWIARMVSKLQLRAHKTKIDRIGMDNIKAPYILLCNHNAFFDFFVAISAVHPAKANYVVAIDGFIVALGKKFYVTLAPLMERAGCICKRKFTNDLSLIRHIRTVLERGHVAVIYPEARYSLCGTTAVLPDSLGKMCKMMKVPVVTLMCHGHHINSPFWRLGNQNVPTTAEFSLLYTPEQIESLSVEEINAGIRERFVYDDYQWQFDNKIEIKDPRRAVGLHKVLYQCPHCGAEYKMISRWDRIRCTACHKEWKFTTLGRLEAVNGETEFEHVPDWYEWERENVRREVREGRYRLSCPVHVASFPNNRHFRPLGKGWLIHDEKGFHCEVDAPEGHLTLDRPASGQYSCHIEYEYLRQFGDALDLSTLDDTWFVYPETKNFSLTKISLATEELFVYVNEKKKTN